MPIDNRILGEGLVQEKQAGYLRKAYFCSNFDLTDEKDKKYLKYKRTWELILNRSTRGISGFSMS